ncbi:MAG: outer membrane protein assembly factor BamA [Candidatus Eisenbacteria bacterium]|uniref:Outer membrane protein assembly factor BamA n=1 Tax=Eiseniibacteriota bacterium TaxID=2212470 RepID=A0A849SRD5_UNCEI|nr:outer membrane protein assembly factor BamA [Candidatus Eisenbacteria bacterium]
MQGNSHTDTERILRSFEVAPGSRFSQEAVRRGVRKLYALGLLEDVEVQTAEHGEVVDLIVIVKERPHITKVEIVGNQKRETSEIEKKVFLRVGEAFSGVAANHQLDTLRQWYRDEGFPRATVQVESDTAGQAGGVLLRLRISEGERLRITQVRFEGVHAFESKKLRKSLVTKPKGLLGGGQLKDESFVEDREKLEGYYHNHGYRDARVTDVRTDPGTEARALTLVVTIEEGPRYVLGDVQWSGATVLKTTELENLWKRRPAEVYDRSRIQRAQAETYGEYAERGYLYLGVEPLETVRGDTVDVSFAISEGRPSNVRFVQIEGNRGTREHVIRREIDVREGDRFKRSALVRSQGDLMRLGFFENVDIDFQPADSTDVDLTLRVKEKSVGTASAGASYTGETGFTFFVELGHNNVLGNGQALQLHLERGAEREDYYLSFTEPWFRGSPTLLGISVFNSQRARDIYDEKRVGASVRLGRPLPWPDYSRGTVSYRLEDVTIREGDVALTPEQQALLSGVKFNEPTRTSSVELGFMRNSTDNPFYPKKGTRLTGSSEFAGGPFGGSVNFNKQRAEGRAYLPSLLKGVTTMLKGRIGFVGEYQDQRREVPAYERFRLGGGTTLDPLRGYDDYQIVPRENVRDVQVAIDTVTTGADSGRVVYNTSRTRYPGGRWMTAWTIEQQFAIAHPLHGVLFLDAGNAWNFVKQYRPLDLQFGAGAGVRLEIPILGNVGFDYAYGFDRDDGPRWVGHFLLGPASF